MQKELEQRERELISLATVNHERSTLLKETVNQLKKIDKISDQVYSSEIRSLRKQLKSHIDQDKSWKLFKTQFNEMHDGFFDRPDLRFDGLSLNERKLCAFIKMRMSNHEITQLTHITDIALRKAINRLKKKLDLGPKDDIRKFLFQS